MENLSTENILLSLETITAVSAFGLDDNNSNSTDRRMFSLPELLAFHRPSVTLIDRYVTIVWYVVGFPGNLASLYVWIQPGMRHSSGCYLAALATTDFFFLIMHFCFELQSAWDVTVLKLPILCELFPVFFLASQYLSPLLVLGFTTERYIAICHPFRRETFCSTRRAVCVIIFLVTCSLSLHVIQAYFWRYDPVTHDCGIRPEVTVNDAGSLWSVWSWVTELLVFGVVPVAILILNILVILETRKLSAIETRLKSMQMKRKSLPTSTSGMSATTCMLLAVSFYLIATTLPVTVLYAIYFSFPMGDFESTEPEVVRGDAKWQKYLTYWTVRTFVQELCMSHFAGNFLIYLATGKMFRTELRRLVGRVRSPCQKMEFPGGMNANRKREVRNGNEPFIETEFTDGFASSPIYPF